MLSHWKVTRRFSSLPIKTACSAKVDVIRLRRSELIQELCKTHATVHGTEFPGPGVKSWASKFIASAHLLESYMLLRHHKSAKNLMYRFRAIDPDGAERSVVENKHSLDKNGDQDLEEVCFLTQFAFFLKEAGYEEIPPETVKKCLESRHKYENIELEAQHKNYTFVRFWVCGRREADAELLDTKITRANDENEEKGVLHERVIVASKNKTSHNMILKGFKDVPVGHFEALLPEATIRIPVVRKVLLSGSLFATGIIAFFNIFMTILNDFKVDIFWIMACFTGFLAYQIYGKYTSQRNKYILAWKKMLYYKSTANNAGLVLETVNRAHERTLKEALLVYGTALRLAKSDMFVTEDEISKAICVWLSAVNRIPVNVCDIDLSATYCLLQRLGLLVLKYHDLKPEFSQFQVLLPEEAAKCLLFRVQEIAAE